MLSVFSSSCSFIFLSILILMKMDAFAQQQYTLWNMDSLRLQIPFSNHLQEPPTDSTRIYYDSLSTLYWKYKEPENENLIPLDTSSSWTLCSGYVSESISHPYMSNAQSVDMFLVPRDSQHHFSGAEILSELTASDGRSINSLVHTGSFMMYEPDTWYFMQVDDYLIAFIYIGISPSALELKSDGEYFGYFHTMQFWYYFKKAD